MHFAGSMYKNLSICPKLSLDSVLIIHFVSKLIVLIECFKHTAKTSVVMLIVDTS